METLVVKSSHDFDLNSIRCDDLGSYSLDFDSDEDAHVQLIIETTKKSDVYELSLLNAFKRDCEEDNRPERTLRIEQRSDSGSSELGCKVWNAAIMLCDYLRANHAIVRNKTVLDIGCGTAIASFVAIDCGAETVTAADCGPLTLNNIMHTVKQYDDLLLEAEAERGTISSSSSSSSSRLTLLALPRWASNDGKIRVRTHLWEDDEEIANSIIENRAKFETTRHWSNVNGFSCPKMSDDEKFDSIILSDCLYFSQQEIPLAKAIALRLKKNIDSTVTLFQTRRTTNKLVEERFRNLCELEGLEVYLEDVLIDQNVLLERAGVHETRHTIGYALMRMKWRI
jgi:predicted nicotinamide N-methyase